MNNSKSRSIQMFGIHMSVNEYDDEKLLRACAWGFLRHRMTPLERRSLAEMPLVSDLKKWFDHPAFGDRRNYGEPSAHGLFKYNKSYQLAEEQGHVPDEEILAVFAGDLEGYRSTAIDRVIAEFSDEIPRCPQCVKVLRTKLAEQCPWCLHVWRD